MLQHETNINIFTPCASNLADLAVAKISKKTAEKFAKLFANFPNFISDMRMAKPPAR